MQNASWTELQVIQRGQGNAVELNQQGMYNEIVLEQEGNLNQMTVLQSGDLNYFMGIQIGNENTLNAEQTGYLQHTKIIQKGNGLSCNHRSGIKQLYGLGKYLEINCFFFLQAS